MLVFSRCDSWRPVVLAVDERQKREVEEEQRELAEKYQRATCDQLLAKVQADFLVLRSRAPTKETEAAESLLDAKYLKDRQRTFGLLLFVRPKKKVSTYQIRSAVGTKLFLGARLAWIFDILRTGQDWCQKMMAEKFKLLTVDATLNGALTAFSKFCSGKTANGRVLLI